jgi:hypothetical protein
MPLAVLSATLDLRVMLLIPTVLRAQQVDKQGKECAQEPRISASGGPCGREG